MKYFITCAAMIAASPALAHPGMHLHPHGTLMASVLMIGGALASIGGAAVLYRVRK